MEEKKYPIYRFSATWNQSDYKNNGTSCRQMYREKLTKEELNSKLEEFKKGIINRHENVEFLNATINYIEDETWVGKWFCHFTFNQFYSDEDAIRSFQEFVTRKEIKNEENGHYNNEMNMDKPQGYYCLMGAEDYRDWETDRKSTRLNSSHSAKSRMPSSA